MQSLQSLANNLLLLNEEADALIQFLEGLREQTLRAQEIGMVAANREVFYRALAAHVDADTCLRAVRRIRLSAHRQWRLMGKLMKDDSTLTTVSPKVPTWTEAFERNRRLLETQKYIAGEVEASLRTLTLFPCCHRVIWSAEPGWD